jgi:putative ABC transport system ATP-binding protein
VILADEPTAALDSVSGRMVMEMLKELAREQGRAVVIVTHDSRAFSYADRIVHIEDGRLREEPTPPVHAGAGIAHTNEAARMELAANGS